MSKKINNGPKIREEKATVSLMIQLYCRKHHNTKNELCEDCQTLADYAQTRLSFCRFGEQKTTCKKCPVHCYRKDMREKIQKIMCFSGPRMLIYHPIYALKHITKSIIK
ncbi:nitrous oxide-stimulated promoter family protein [Lactococcus nasutitermitis]|uniref:Nitrous oxide-stimulated promoter family protein n=1 Tax=Lactococcus nasutitermitis TaxID=1652957 RepID=A0ABV9J9E9_9LACT|nr:nitrous oxide-stimulated promoter family protein [Lactococcus nasutitermitis]